MKLTRLFAAVLFSAMLTGVSACCIPCELFSACASCLGTAATPLLVNNDDQSVDPNAGRHTQLVNVSEESDGPAVSY